MRPVAFTRRGRPWLACAIAVGLVAAIATVRAGAGASFDGWIVVAREPLAPGLLLDSETVPVVLMATPAPTSLGLNGVFGDPAAVVGRRVSSSVEVGEPLTEAALGGAPGSGPRPLEPGERAVAVPLSTFGVSAAGVIAGARVDVVASSGEGLAGSTRLVVADAEVLSVTDPVSANGIDVSGQALLRVSSRHALTITAALNFAREVRLLTRPREESGAFRGPRQVSAP